jgi:hypothetical protein
LFPAPHPLDYDWRFDDATSRLLADQAGVLSRSGLCALLGVPSLVPHMPAETSVVFLDANPRLVEAVLRVRPSTRAIRADIGVDALPNARAQVVVADPPWYPGHMRAFIWAASQLSGQDSVLLLGMPPIGIRPGVRSERWRLISWSQRCGYELTSVEPGRLRYESPQFEVNALQAVGLPEVPADWRIGDLLTFRLTRSGLAPRPRRPERHTWIDVSLGSSSIRFRRLDGRPAQADPRLVGMIDGDVLPSVSRRDTRRNRVMVWTAGNRVFECVDPELGSVITSALVANEPVVEPCESMLGHPLTSAQRRRVAVAAMQIEDLISIEREPAPGRHWAWIRTH